MFRKYVYNKVTWFDFKHPHSKEMKDVAESYNIPESIVAHFLSKNPVVEVFATGDYIFLSLPFPKINKQKSKAGFGQSYTIRFIIGNNSIFTAREMNDKAFRITSKHIKRSEKTNIMDSPSGSSSLEPMRVILTNLYKEIGDEIEQVQKNIMMAESLSSSEKEHYFETIASQAKIWEAFDSLCQEFFSDPESIKPLETIIAKHKEVETKRSNLKTGKVQVKKTKSQFNRAHLYSIFFLLLLGILVVPGLLY